ncbi:hypothetical protein H5410_046110 [Solanum commersonii]|uniref:Uncharacterized protein n=1 Tax=Solanum commersonii TaxID=4109 RepID=A0A9J5XEM2_SOLCO|nr:hypothetical protein H5410_046110 [Solanum commersonii]
MGLFGYDRNTDYSGGKFSLEQLTPNQLYFSRTQSCRMKNSLHLSPLALLISMSIYSFQKLYAAKDHLVKLVGIADQLGDSPFGIVHRCLALAFSIIVFWIIRRHSNASRNCSVIRRLLIFTTNLILSFRAKHTGTKGEDKTFWRLTEWVRETQVQQFKKDVSNSAT